MKCQNCKGEFPEIIGPTHKYMESSPGCWAKYGEILTREYSDTAFQNTHRLTVDAYAAQHPSSETRQNIQSVGVHLVRLCLMLEYGLNPEKANDAMLEAGKKKQSFSYLKPPNHLGAITVADFKADMSVDEHIALVQAWALSVWEAWAEYHSVIRSWLPEKYVE